MQASPVGSFNMYEKDPSQDIEVENEDGVIFVLSPRSPARPTSFYEGTTVSTSSKTSIPGPNQSSKSAPPAPSQLSPRTGAPSTASVNKTGALSVAHKKSARFVTAVNKPGRSVNHAQSVNSMLPAQPQPGPNSTKAQRMEVS